jgi:hypothetical protein
MAFKVMPEHRHKRDVNTYACANTDPRYDRVECLVIDDEKEHGEACEEKEQRKVPQCGQQFNCPRKISFVCQRPRKRTPGSSLVYADCIMAE